MSLYLLHFDPPYRHAGHYLGYTSRGVAERVEEHKAGAGARLPAVAVAAGCTLVLARTWSKGTRADERKYKGADHGAHHRGGLRRLCPICRKAAQHE